MRTSLYRWLWLSCPILFVLIYSGYAVGNEKGCFVNFTSFSQTVDEDVGEVTVELVASKSPNIDVVVYVILEVSSTVRNEHDLLYENPLRVTIPAGSTSPVHFSIPIIDDAEPEGTEQIMLAIERVSEHAYTGTQSEHVVMILDNDGTIGGSEEKENCSLQISLVRNELADLGTRVLDESSNEVQAFSPIGDVGFASGQDTPLDLLPGTYYLELSKG